MKHFLDYDLLKEWGFKWATKGFFDGEAHAMSYVIEKVDWTDYHGDRSIYLCMGYNVCFDDIWELKYLGDECSVRKTLYHGKIANKKTLITILKNCIIVKPNF